MNINIKPSSRKNDIVTRELLGEILIYDLIDNKAFCLNNTSALIWQMCDGTKSVDEISRSIDKKMNSTVTDDFVWLAITQFKENKLLDDNNIFISQFAGMSRREVINKVGLATVIALPFVNSLMAPRAAAAASCLPSGAPCIGGAAPFCCNFTCPVTGLGQPGTCP